MIKNIYSTIFLLMLAIGIINSKTEHFIIPNDGNRATNSILNSIDNAKESISIAMYYFTKKDIALKLLEASERNIEINLVLDNVNQRAIRDATLPILERNIKINVYLYNRKSPGRSNSLMHHKFMIIDSAEMFIGSLNYTTNGFKYNRDFIMHITEEPETIALYKREFENLKQDSIYKFIKILGISENMVTYVNYLTNETETIFLDEAHPKYMDIIRLLYGNQLEEIRNNRSQYTNNPFEMRLIRSAPMIRPQRTRIRRYLP